MTRHHIVLVNDHPIDSTAIRSALKTQRDLSIAPIVPCVSASFAAVAHEDPDLVIIDVKMSAQRVMELVKDLFELHPALKFLIVTGDPILRSPDIQVRKTVGFTSRDDNPTTFLAALRSMLSSRQPPHPKSLADSSTEPCSCGDQANPVTKCSERELEVFRLFGKGRNTREIAFFTNLKPACITSYSHHIRSKLGYSSTREMRRAAARWVRTHG